MKQQLYFFYTTNQARNKFISVVSGEIVFSAIFRDTCLYTSDELEKIKKIIKKNNINFGFAKAKSINCQPTDFNLNPLKEITMNAKPFTSLLSRSLIILVLFFISCKKEDTAKTTTPLPTFTVTASNMVEIGTSSVRGQQITIAMTNAGDVKQLLLVNENYGKIAPIYLPKVNADTTYKYNFWSNVANPCYYFPIHFEVTTNANVKTIFTQIILSN